MKTNLFQNINFKSRHFLPKVDAPRILYILVTFLACVGYVGYADAETVTQKQAMGLAQQFFNQAYKETTAPVKMVYNGKRLTTDRLFTPFYVYNQPRGGFVIISAENKTYPILAYSLTDSFDPDGLTPSEKGWLSGYAHDIEMIRYDPRVPEEAVKAWQDYPGYVVAMLNAPYASDDVSLDDKAVRESILELLGVDDEDSSRDGEFSAFYTPDQWQEMIDAELERKREVATGFVDTSHKLSSGVIHGKKGDYYRIQFERPNNWLMRLSPGEFLGERLVALIGEPRYLAPVEEEEPAFEFYDSYQTRLRDEAFPSTNSIAEERMSLMEQSPIVKAIGGGHFDILMPENVRLAMLYNLNGSHLGRATYGGTSNVAHINLEGEPQGFYVAVIFTESGLPYGVKLYR